MTHHALFLDGITSPRGRYSAGTDRLPNEPVSVTIGNGLLLSRTGQYNINMAILSDGRSIQHRLLATVVLEVLEVRTVMIGNGTEITGGKVG